jgi:outer membrane receptor protein involved in Fe transport
LNAQLCKVKMTERSVALLLVALLLAATTAVHAAVDRNAHLNVDLVTKGKPVTGAVIELSSKSESVEITIPCNNAGRCVSDAIPADMYFVVVRTASISAALGQPIALVAGTSYHAVIQVDASGAVAIQSLGIIRITPTGTLSTAAAPSAQLDTQMLSELGEQDVASAIAQVPGVTMNRPAGGAVGLPVSIMIRGDDPKETVVELDGSPINNGNTGDFDLSLLDPAAFQNVQIVYGLAPASLVGANVEGGTLNFHTLEPTAVPQGFIRYTTASFDTSAETFATTGSADKLGYAFEARSLYQLGQVNDFPVIDSSTGHPATLGSAITGTNALAKLTYALPRDGTIQASVLTFGSNEDLSAALSSPVNPNDAGPGSLFYSYEGSERSNVTTFYDLSARVPIGPPSAGMTPPAFITAGFTMVNARQTVTGPAYNYNSYFLDTADILNNGLLEYDRLLPNADLTFIELWQGERLTVPWQDAAGESSIFTHPLADDGTAPFPIPSSPTSPTQTQTNHTFLARYLWNGGTNLEYTAVGYLSTFSTFGTSFNPRGAVVWRPTHQTVVRASIGTGFQAPALSDKIVPVPTPLPDPSGLITVGNPDLTADHTLQEELDFEHSFSQSPSALNGQLDLYHVNQHGDDIPYIPAGASLATPMLSYPINTSNTVWQGLVLQLQAPFRNGVSAQSSYTINEGYPLALPPALVGSSGNLVPGQQFQNVPLHRGTFSVQQQWRRLGWMAGLAYEGVNNDLNQPPFATVNANVSYRFDHTTVVLAGNNLTNVYSGNFQLTNAGVPYPGLTGPILSNAYQLRACNVTASLTQHW